MSNSVLREELPPDLRDDVAVVTTRREAVSDQENAELRVQRDVFKRAVALWVNEAMRR